MMVVGFWNFKSAISAEYVMDFLSFCLPCCYFLTASSSREIFI